MKNKFQFKGYVKVNDNVRYEIREYLVCDNEGEMPYKVTLYFFECFKRPYLLGLLGKKCWCDVGEWVSVEYGTRWCDFLLKRWKFNY